MPIYGMLVDEVCGGAMLNSYLRGVFCAIPYSLILVHSSTIHTVFFRAVIGSGPTYRS